MNLSRDLIGQGYTHQELARRSRSGELLRVRRGAYVAGGAQGPDLRETHRALLEATVRQSSPEAVVSHASAAVLHGLPVWSDSLTVAHLTRDRPNGGRRRSWVQVHGTPLAPDEVTMLDGITVTSLARTVVDLARSQSLARGVAVGDAALALGLAPAELELSLRRARGRTGIGVARRVVAMGDGRSESVGESTSRVVLIEHGVPVPELQFEVFGLAGRLVGRSDFCWEAMRTLGEFDGRVKYQAGLRPGQDPSEVVFNEKVREDALRDLGWEVVRWTWDDLQRPWLLVARLNRAFARGLRLAA